MVPVAPWIAARLAGFSLDFSPINGGVELPMDSDFDPISFARAPPCRRGTLRSRDVVSPLRDLPFR